ncbi:hypothetical protein KI387_040909, partial [Taxus chinensis]
DIVDFIVLVLENLSLSSDNNEEFIYCLKDWYRTRDMCKSNADQWALYAKAVLDRTRLALTDKAEHYQEVLQPSAEYLGTLLGVQLWAVGSKSCNIAYIRGRLPSWVNVPMSVALPFGVFEEVLSEKMNKDVADKITALKNLVAKGDLSKLGDIRQTVLQLKAPFQLINGLKSKMQSAKMRWPADEGEQRWQQAWMAIKK